MLAIDLRGRVALVLGGSRGIGAGITKALSAAGAHAVFTHTGNPDRAGRVQDLLREIRAEGGEAEDAAVDSLDASAVEGLVARVVRERGAIDILVCNTGRNLARTVEETTLEDWRRFVDLNLTSAFIGVKAAVPRMAERGYGRVTLIGSSAAYDGGGGAADYAAAKAGLIGLMKHLSRAYLKRGINTNLVHPCVIDTDLVRERYSTPEKWAALVSQIPVGRTGRPEDVAGIVAFLASHWGDYIAGQEILLDGGRTLFK